MRPIPAFSVVYRPFSRRRGGDPLLDLSFDQMIGPHADAIGAVRHWPPPITVP
jgi:hypothetical protein